MPDATRTPEGGDGAAIRGGPTAPTGLERNQCQSVCRVSVCRVVECGRRLLPDAHCTTLHHAVWSSVRHTAHLTRDPPRTRKLCPRPEPAIGGCKESKRLNHCPINNHCCLPHARQVAEQEVVLEAARLRALSLSTQLQIFHRHPGESSSLSRLSQLSRSPLFAFPCIHLALSRGPFPALPARRKLEAAALMTAHDS